LAELGYGWAYRILDAQHFGLAQRRKRVFVVGCLGDWRRAAAVLFEPASLRWDSPPCREAREGIARPLAAGSPGGSGYRNDADTADNPIAYGGNRQSGPLDVATAVNAHGGPHGRLDFESETFITHSLRADGFDASEDGTGRGTPLVAYNIVGGAQEGRNHAYRTEVSGCLQHKGLAATGNEAGTLVAQAFDILGTPATRGGAATDVHSALRSRAPGASEASTTTVIATSAVRRLTPRECERLQGFPDDWTAIQYQGRPAADGPRYRAVGNAFAVPVVRWIARRLVREDAAGVQLAEVAD
jgi:DNA (cytosine-5)-methyltransferase 1